MKKPISWILLLVLAVVCYAISYVIGGVIGDSIGFLGFILLALGIVNAIVAAVKRNKNKPTQ